MYLSSRVEEPNSKVNKSFVSEQQSSTVFARVFAFVYVPLDRYNYDYAYTTPGEEIRKIESEIQTEFDGRCDFLPILS